MNEELELYKSEGSKNLNIDLSEYPFELTFIDYNDVHKGFHLIMPALWF